MQITISARRAGYTVASAQNATATRRIEKLDPLDSRQAIPRQTLPEEYVQLGEWQRGPHPFANARVIGAADVRNTRHPAVRAYLDVQEQKQRERAAQPAFIDFFI